jgi:hypothetical protein
VSDSKIHEARVSKSKAFPDRTFVLQLTFAYVMEAVDSSATTDTEEKESPSSLFQSRSILCKTSPTFVASGFLSIACGIWGCNLYSLCSTPDTASCKREKPAIPNTKNVFAAVLRFLASAKPIWHQQNLTPLPRCSAFSSFGRLQPPTVGPIEICVKIPDPFEVSFLPHRTGCTNNPQRITCPKPSRRWNRKSTLHPDSYFIHTGTDCPDTELWLANY